MSNSNLLKRSYIRENGQRIIDYNDLISNKLEHLKKLAEDGNMSAGFVSGISAQAVESLVSDDTAESEMAAGLEALLTDVSENEADASELKELAAGVLAEAHEEADALLADANEKADAMFKAAHKDGRDSGYKDGFSKGYAEGALKAESEYSARMEELEAERNRLRAEYDAMYAQTEPVIVNTILDVIGQVTGIVYENNKDILIHLINRVLNDVEASGEYVIKVSSDDYDFIIGKQARLYAASAKDMNIDIIEDKSLSAGKCLIETDGGIFDCSLDVQMEQLVNDIRLLAGV